jgi:ankyrin repeat protein
VEVVKTLLAAKAEVNKANNDGETPLYWASRNGHVEVVKTLLAAEADVDKAEY